MKWIIQIQFVDYRFADEIIQKWLTILFFQKSSEDCIVYAELVLYSVSLLIPDFRVASMVILSGYDTACISDTISAGGRAYHALMAQLLWLYIFELILVLNMYEYLPLDIKQSTANIVTSSVDATRNSRNMKTYFPLKPLQHLNYFSGNYLSMVLFQI